MRDVLLKSCLLLFFLSAYMSPFGELPLQCFPDAQPHLQEVEDLGLTGTPAKIREELHKLNAKNCHPRQIKSFIIKNTQICSSVTLNRKS